MTVPPFHASRPARYGVVPGWPSMPVGPSQPGCLLPACDGYGHSEDQADSYCTVELGTHTGLGVEVTFELTAESATASTGLSVLGLHDNNEAFLFRCATSGEVEALADQVAAFSQLLRACAPLLPTRQQRTWINSPAGDRGPASDSTEGQTARMLSQDAPAQVTRTPSDDECEHGSPQSECSEVDPCELGLQAEDLEAEAIERSLGLR